MDPHHVPVLRTVFGVRVARVSVHQEPENQLAELRQFAAARGCTATEYVDRGISGVKDRRARP